MTTTVSATYTGKVEWEHLDTSDDSIMILDDGEIGDETIFVDAASGNLAVNEVWFESGTIAPYSLYVIDLSDTFIYAFAGKRVYSGFSNIKAINIFNCSGDKLYIGNSGVGSGVSIFGATQTIGYSGIAGWSSAVGYNINSSHHNLGIYNPESTTASYTISVVGIRELENISGSFNDDFNDDFRYIIYGG